MIDDASLPRTIFHVHGTVKVNACRGYDERLDLGGAGLFAEVSRHNGNGYEFVSGSDPDGFRPGARFSLDHVRCMVKEMIFTPGDRLRDCRTSQVWEVQEYNTNRRHEAAGTIRHRLVEVMG